MENTTTTAPSAAPSAVSSAAPTTAAPTVGAPFRLHRSRTDRMLGGVAGGLAESLDADATLVRIAFVVLTLLGGGIGIPLYIAAWIITPEA